MKIETTFVYDGDGNRGKKIEGGETVIYINQYYEKNITTGVVTQYYYLGGRLVALKNGSTMRYIHQDHLGGTALITDNSGNKISSVKYLPYGETRVTSGTMDTDKLYTGQRLDDTGLYFYNARYYDPTIGRFISPDTIVPSDRFPQSWNRYSYCYNNPLTLIDPTGHWPKCLDRAVNKVGNAISKGYECVKEKVVNNIDTIQTGLDFVGMVPGVGELADATNGIIYLARGDELNAGLSLAACIPIAGNLATVGKLANKTDNLIDAGRGVVKNLDKVDNFVDTTKSIKNNGEDILVLGRGPKERLERLAKKEGGHISSTLSNNPRDIFKKNYSDIRKADKIVQYMDNIPTTLDEALKIGGQYSRAEVYMINQRKDLLMKTIRKFEF